MLVNRSTEPAAAAAQLVGRELDGGWIVTERLDSTSSSGGAFSFGYKVQHQDGTRAFLKALDFSAVMGESDPIGALEALTKAYIFERVLLTKCRSMDRVITVIDYGKVQVSRGIDGLVYYMIIEEANGTVKVQRDALMEFDVAWALRSLHQMSVGIQQLHSAGITHQDIKPANVLVCKDNITRISDLGCASDRSVASDNDVLAGGDMAYAPPEAEYGSELEYGWDYRRAGDLYLLGSMAVFMFSQFSMTQLLKQNLLSEIPTKSTFVSSDVYPGLYDAFEGSMKFVESSIPEFLREDLILIVRQLCDPDPRRRGIRQLVGTVAQYSLEKFISKFNLLASRAECRAYK